MEVITFKTNYGEKEKERNKNRKREIEENGRKGKKRKKIRESWNSYLLWEEKYIFALFF